MANSPRIKNTLEGRKKTGGIGALMTPKTIIALVLIGIFSFGALVTLSGYAGDLRQKNNGQAHALSRSATGYAGLVKLLAEMDYDVRMSRTETVSYEDRSALRIFTFTRPFQADKMDDLSLNSPTLIIMPKWLTYPYAKKQGWVQKRWSGSETFTMSSHERDLKELAGDVTFSQFGSDDKSITYKATKLVGKQRTQDGLKIEHIQTISGSDLLNIYEVDNGTFLVKIIGTDIYILSDPDFMNTMGISSRTRAQLAVQILDSVIEDSGADPMRVDFDLTIHGFGGQSNIIKVLTQPPFLAATLCLLAAGALIAWQAFSRFGDPLRVERDYALGKFTLADNAARFIRIAGREPNMAKDYTALIRKQVVRGLNLESRRPQEIDKILEHREKALQLQERYVDLEARAAQPGGLATLMQLAKDLNNWKKTMILGEKQ